MNAMTESLATRAFRPFVDLEIRNDDSPDGRTLAGITVPFDEPTPIRDFEGEYVEIFRRGAFARTINAGVERVKLLGHHDRAVNAIGRATMIREDGAGLYGEFLVPRTQAGDEVLELARNGVLDAFSIGFEPIETRWNDDQTLAERTEVRLREVSVVNWGARIAGVRSWMPTTFTSPATPVVDGEPEQQHDIDDPAVRHVADVSAQEINRLRKRAELTLRGHTK